MSMFTNSLKFITLSTFRGIANYKSSLTLQNLYPKSSLSITKPVKIPESNTGFSGYIPIEKLEVTYSRSSGPGGQNVNKVDTKVDLRFHVESADWLSEEIKQNICTKFKNKINKDGFLVVRSEKTRSQLYNQADAINVMRDIIRKAAAPASTPPSQETVNMLRKRKEKANKVRLIEKRMHSQKKSTRREQIDLL